MARSKKFQPTRFMLPTSHYDKDRADHAVNFIQALKHTKGVWAGKPFLLFDWQEQIIRDLFGVVKPNGYRQFNTAFVEICKKAGKQLALDTPVFTPKGWKTMGTLTPGGREQGILAGANVIMPNISPPQVRGSYLLYDNKIGVGDDEVSSRDRVVQAVRAIGYEIVVGRGDYQEEKIHD